MSAAGSNRASRRLWVLALTGIIAAGLLSRVVRTGWVGFDKYLGDALYAAMVYLLVRPFFRPAPAAVWACVLMIAIECFQLTGIPAHLYAAGSRPVRVAARLMGTEFGVLDLAAYAVGIAAIYAADRGRRAGTLAA